MTPLGDGPLLSGAGGNGPTHCHWLPFLSLTFPSFWRAISRPITSWAGPVEYHPNAAGREPPRSLVQQSCQLVLRNVLLNNQLLGPLRRLAAKPDQKEAASEPVPDMHHRQRHYQAVGGFTQGIIPWHILPF